MGRIRQEGTAPELALRSELWRLGGRFRCNVRSIAGWPDIANRRARVAIFVDGCFWHCCPRHGTVPKTRTAYWQAKFTRNLAKRAEVRAALTQWHLFEFYECEIREDADGCARRVAAVLRPRPAPRKAMS